MFTCSEPEVDERSDPRRTKGRDHEKYGTEHAALEERTGTPKGTDPGEELLRALGESWGHVLGADPHRDAQQHRERDELGRRAPAREEPLEHVHRVRERRRPEEHPA